MNQSFFHKELLSSILVFQMIFAPLLWIPKSWANDPPVPPPLTPEVRDALNQLERCASLPSCPANPPAYRGVSANPCEFSQQQLDLLNRYMQTMDSQMQALSGPANAVALAIGVGAGSLVSAFLGWSLHDFYAGNNAELGTASLMTFLLVGILAISGGWIIEGRRNATNAPLRRTLHNAGYDTARVRRLLAAQNRRLNGSWLRRFGARLQQRLSRGPSPSTRPELNATSQTAPGQTPEGAVRSTSATANTAPPRTGVRIADIRDDGHGNPCVTEESTEAAVDAAAGELEAAAASERARAVANQSRATTEMTSHMCSAERVQQYAQSLAVDRATRWQEFQRRQHLDASLMRAEDADRFNQAQRRDLAQGAVAAAGAVAGGALICASGGTATPLVVLGQQFVTRAVTGTAVLALAAGTVSLVPADASAEELAQAQRCGLNNPRVSLPQASGAQAYMGIPATVVTERRNPVASYEPSQASPMCWAPAATACAALRQEFSGHNIARLTPSVCGAVAAPEASPTTTTAAPMSLAPSMIGTGAH